MLVTSGQIGKLFDADSGKCYASDLSELPEFDFSDEKWNQSVISLMTVGKGVYGFTCGKSNILGSRYQYVLYVNKTLLNSILGDGAVDQLYDLQASGEWTWDKLTEILTRCKAESKSAIGSQVYGLAAMGHDLFRAAMISDGHSFIGQDADGKLVSNLADPELIADLNWAYGLFADGLLNSGKKEKLLYGGELQLFTENKTAMLLTSISMIYTIQNSMPDTDLAMVCFPKGPKVTDYTLCSDQSIYIIPNCEATAAKLNDIAFAYDTYSDPYPEDVAPAETKREYSVLKSACDPRAYEETWSILSEKAVYMSNKESLIDFNLQTFCMMPATSRMLPKKSWRSTSRKFRNW